MNKHYVPEDRAVLVVVIKTVVNRCGIDVEVRYDGRRSFTAIHRGGKPEAWEYRGHDDNGEREECTMAEALVHIAQKYAAKDEREWEYLLSPHHYANCDITRRAE